MPGIPVGEDGPVFRAPWEAQAFAMTIALHGQGRFTWTEWAEALAAEIRDAPGDGDLDTGQDYYEHWLSALERVCVARELTTLEALHDRERAWERAAAATPHGQPILLEDDPGL